MHFSKVTLFDVALKVLPQCDEELGQYAVETFRREGIEIKTLSHVEEPRSDLAEGHQREPGQQETKKIQSCYTPKSREEGDIPGGMIVWSVGLQMKPFVELALGKPSRCPEGA